MDAKGDLFGASANDTPARVPVGTDGQALLADSSQAVGVRWGTISGTSTIGSVADVAALRAMSVSGTPVPQEVRSTGAVYVYDSSSAWADDSTLFVQPASVTGSNPGRWVRTTVPREIRPFGRALQRLANARTGKFRVLQSGTSIESFDNSPGRVFVERLRDIYGDGQEQNYYGGNWGGDFSTTRNGWVKQNYGGLIFTRSRADNTATPLSLTGYFDTLVVEFSKETTGGTWTVLVDGSLALTINSNGAQQYGNQASFSTTLGPHSVQLVPPTGSGYAFFEAVRLVDSTKTGVETIDSTRGGSSLRNAVDPNSAGTGTAIETVTNANAGLDGVFGRTDLDLIILGHLVNDAGQNGSGLGEFNARWKSSMDRIVSLTAATDTPVVLIIEMAGHNIMPVETNTWDQFNVMAEYMRKLARENNHVYALDWDGMTRLADISAYAARYYSATGLNTTTGAYTGDFIHPNTAGMRVATNALCAAVGVTPPAYDLVSTAIQLRQFKAASQPSNVTTTVDGASKTYAQAEGLALKAKAQQTAYRQVNYYRDDLTPNETTTIPALITASGTSDAYGKYKVLSNVVQSLDNLVDWTGGEKVTVTAKVAGTWSFKPFESTTTMYDGAAVLGTGTGSSMNGSASLGVPVVVTFEVGASASSPSLQITADKLYEFCVTRSTVPVLTRKVTSTRKRFGPPVLLTTDPAFDPTLVGQQFFEDLGSSVYVYKTLVDRCTKYDTATQTYSEAGLYKAEDRTTAAWRMSRVGSPTGSVASGWAGGMADQNGNFNPIQFATFPINVAANWTILFKPLSSLTGLRVRLIGSSDRWLNPDGTWNTSAVNVFVPGAKYTGVPLALTIPAPTTLAATIGNSVTLSIEPQGYNASTPVGTVTLVKGVSACV